jgi:hypothetical protein
MLGSRNINYILSESDMVEIPGEAEEAMNVLEFKISRVKIERTEHVYFVPSPESLQNS